MRLRRIGAGLAAGALLMTGMAMAGPASANGYQPLTLTNSRTGANPITAGGGDSTEFTVTVTNPNGYAVDGAIFGEADSGMILDSVSGSGLDCEVNGQLFLCQLQPPTTPSGFPANSTFNVTVKAQAAEWVTAPDLELCSSVAWNPPDSPSLDAPNPPCGAVGAPGSGPAGGPNGAPYQSAEARATVDVIQIADLELTVTQPGQTDPGVPTTVTFTLKNNGPSFTDQVKIKGTLPAGLTFVSAPFPWLCQVTGQEVECTLALAVAPTKADADYPPLTWTLNTAKPGIVASYQIDASASSPAQDPTPNNAKTTSTIPVTPVVYDLTKVAGGPYKIGDAVDWTLTVTNKGTIDDAGEITVTDKLPSGLKFVSATGDGWSCSAAGQELTCKRAGLSRGQTSQVIVTTKVIAAGTQKNTAKLSGVSYIGGDSVTSSGDTVVARRLPQSAAPLPPAPFRIKSGKTDQGQKLRTTVRCRPYVAGSAGEVAFCKVTRKGNVVKVKVLGKRKVVVRVVQRAPGTKRYRPFITAKKYIVKP